MSWKNNSTSNSKDKQLLKCMQTAKNIITLPFKGYKNNYKSYQQRIAIQENKTLWCTIAHSRQVHSTLGFSVFLGGAGNRTRPCGSLASSWWSGRILAISPLIRLPQPREEVSRFSQKKKKKAKLRQPRLLGSALPLTASLQPSLGSLIRSPKVQRRINPISQVCWELSDKPHVSRDCKSILQT